MLGQHRPFGIRHPGRWASPEHRDGPSGATTSEIHTLALDEQIPENATKGLFPFARCDWQPRGKASRKIKITPWKTPPVPPSHASIQFQRRSLSGRDGSGGTHRSHVARLVQQPGCGRQIQRPGLPWRTSSLLIHPSSMYLPTGEQTSQSPTSPRTMEAAFSNP
ncbi:uncharacterized protein BKA78DRAFT_161673 [Phyllosticta capitalensis]|uniref:uncharacterized protein n=1 Tax=Phyllosticta capitalensis TaxID=121624 RepID=UPI00312FAB14